MTIARLLRRSILRNRFRSLSVFICAALVAGLAVAATAVVRGAEAGLRGNLQRLGADILVLPWGTITDEVGGVRLMSAAVERWMPESHVRKIAQVEGVAEVSPQLYLATLRGSAYCRLPEMFLVAYDPATDFTLHPWLDEGPRPSLADGEAIAGAQVTPPEGSSTLILFGHPIRVVGRMQPTSTTIDQSVFVSLDTARKLVASAGTQGDRTLAVQPGSVSAVMVRVDLESDPHEVALRILDRVPGAVPLETPDLFQTERRQQIGVLRTLLGVLAVVWLLAVVFMGLVFSLTAHQRRSEIGVLRALGFSRLFALRILLLESLVLALAGGFGGIAVSAASLALSGQGMAEWAGIPLRAPSLLGLLSISLAGQFAALLSVALAAFIPSWRLTRQEVALTMRE